MPGDARAAPRPYIQVPHAHSRSGGTAICRVAHGERRALMGADRGADRGADLRADWGAGSAQERAQRAVAFFAATRFSISRMSALPIGGSVSTPSVSVNRASMM